MRGFTYDDSNNLVASRDMSVLVWAYAELTVGAGGSSGGLAFSVNGTISAILGQSGGDPDQVNPIEIMGELELSQGDVLGIRIYSDDPSNTFVGVRIIVTEVQTDGEFSWGIAHSFKQKGVYYFSTDARPYIIPYPGTIPGQVLRIPKDQDNDSSVTFESVTNDSYIFPYWDLPSAPLIDIIGDIKANNTAGGTFSSSDWETRDLNTVLSNGGSSNISALDTNQITLDEGTYLIEATAPAYQVGHHQLRWRNITDSTTDIIGQSGQYTDNSRSASGIANLVGIVTVPGDNTKTYELQHHCEFGESDDGFGQAGNFGESELYATVKITKLS